MLTRGREVVRQCEARLRDLMAEASSAGDYAAVGTLVEWARGVSAVVEAPTTPTPSETRSVRGGASRLKGVRSQVSAAKRRRAGKPRTRQPYPKFTRYRNELVKTGWSKKERKEYVHRAPWRVVEALCRKSLAWRGADFVSDELFPVVTEDGMVVPSYQAYLTLAWLRHEGLVVQNGRRGYHVPAGSDLVELATERWAAMAGERSAG